MEKKIEELNRGIFRYEQSEIILSKDEINEIVGLGEVHEGTIEISNSDNKVFKGVVYSSHEMVKIEDAIFSGIKNTIKYTFNSRQAVVNEVVKGNITIVSDCGEVSIPYTFNILQKAYESSIGMISGLNGFVELARTNEQEALKIFNSPQFDKVILNKDAKNDVLYRTLIRGASKNIAMEEFLVAAGKKKPVAISVPKYEYTYDISRNPIKDSIIIEKNNWGHCEIIVRSQAPFLKVGLEDGDIIHQELKLGVNNSIFSKNGTKEEIDIYNSNVNSKIDSIVDGVNVQERTDFEKYRISAEHSTETDKQRISAEHRTETDKQKINTEHSTETDEYRINTGQGTELAQNKNLDNQSVAYNATLTSHNLTDNSSLTGYNLTDSSLTDNNISDSQNLADNSVLTGKTEVVSEDTIEAISREVSAVVDVLAEELAGKEKKLNSADDLRAPVKHTGYEVFFKISPDKLHPGTNVGVIKIESVSGVYDVYVTCNYKKGVVILKEGNKLKKSQSDYIRTYLDFRMGKLPLDRYLEITKELVQNMGLLIDNTINELYRIHLQIMMGNESEALELLDDLEARLNDKDEVEPLIRCGYFYLKTLVCKEKEFLTIAQKNIKSYFDRDKTNWKILWILLYIDKKYDNDYAAKLEDIRFQFDNGCKSPIMYYEACASYNKDYNLLGKLGDFEKNVLYFGARNGIITEDVSYAYASIAGRLKEFDYIIFKTLEYLYEEYKQNEVLTAICSMMIKGEKYSNKYFKWYQLGVESQLKMTRLYENYMYSYDENSGEMFPEQVLLYFRYNSDMTDARKTLLYANIIRNKATMPLTYDSYLKQMEPFMLKMLKQHVVNENMKIIYEDLINEDTLTEEMAQDLPYVMFRYDVCCYNPNYVGVIVVHKILSIEQYAQFKDGKAQVNIFSEGAEIFMVDKDGNRYVANNLYTVKKLLNFEHIIEKCYEYNSQDGMLVVNLGDKIDNLRREDNNGKSIRKKLVEVPHLREDYKRKYLYELIQYTYDNTETELLDYYLGIVDISAMQPKERSYIIEYYILRGFTDKAIESILRYGYSNIPVKRLVKLATKSIEAFKEKDAENVALDICAHTFKSGIYDENILKYLVDNYNGSTRSMYDVWKAAYEFQIDTVELEERLIAQLLFAESYIPDTVELFRSYYRNYRNIKVVKAFLNYNAYKYIIKDRVISDVIFEIIKKELSYSFNDIYAMALLKYYSAKEDLTFKELHFADKNIKYFANENIILPFFKNFADKIELPESITDKYFVEYIADPSLVVTIHYSLIEENNESEFKEEIMKDVFLGIRVKEFILFYGDELQYYVVEEGNDDSIITQSMNVSINDSWIDEESRYNKINLMLLTRSVNDEKTLIEVMKSLAITDYIADNISTPL